MKRLTLRDRFRRAGPVQGAWIVLYKTGWPGFDCEDCIGAECGYRNPCYCAYYDCVAPNTPPNDWHIWTRWLHGFLFLDSSPFWNRDDR